jgi:hypothetical protein
MVINGLKSVNDAVSTIDKPATGRVTLCKNELRRQKAGGDLWSRFPTADVKK